MTPGSPIGGSQRNVFKTAKLRIIGQVMATLSWENDSVEPQHRSDLMDSGTQVISYFSLKMPKLDSSFSEDITLVRFIRSNLARTKEETRTRTRTADL